MRNNALNYHLAFALIELIKHSDGTKIQRLNLTVLINGCIVAMKTKAKTLDDIETKIALLREAYEPDMDISPYTYEKQIAFEIELDKLQISLLHIINDHQLVSQSVMQEVMAAKFNETKRMDRKIPT